MLCSANASESGRGRLDTGGQVGIWVAMEKSPAVTGVVRLASECLKRNTYVAMGE